MLRRLGVALGLICVVAVPLAFAAGLFPGFPIVGGAAYCSSYTGAAGTTCVNTVPAGPTQLTGNETIPGDTNLSQGRTPQTVLVTPSALANWEQPTAALAYSTVTFTPNLATSRLFAGTLTKASPAPTIIAAPTNPVSGQVWHIKLLQDATGGRTVSWNSIFKWPSGTAPTLTATASKADVFKCVYDGTDHYCSTTGLNYTP